MRGSDINPCLQYVRSGAKKKPPDLANTMLRGQALRLAQVLLTVAPAFITYGYNQAGVGPLATLQTWYEFQLYHVLN